MNSIGKPERRKKSGFRRYGKWAFILLIIGAIGFTGYKVALSYVSDKLVEQFTNRMMDDEQIEQLINDPNIRKIIEDHADQFDKALIESLGLTVPAMSDKKGESSAEGPGVQPGGPKTAPAKLVVTTREQAAELLLGKFSVSELTDLAGMAQDGLDPDELETIQSKLLSKLTEEEFESIKIVALMEVMKNKK